MVTRESPVAPATRVIPPRPIARASVAAQRRRARSSSTGSRLVYFALMDCTVAFHMQTILAIQTTNRTVYCGETPKTMTTRRQFVQSLPAAGAAFAVAGHLVLDESPARAQEPAPLKGHFHPKGKAPSTFTLDVLKQAKAKLPFVDKKDFEEQKKGFIAPMK